jgi:ribonuclease HI
MAEVHDGQRANPRAPKAFLHFVTGIDGSAGFMGRHGMGRADMQRAPIQKEAPHGRPGYPLAAALDRHDAVRWNLSAPGGLPAHLPNGASAPDVQQQHVAAKLAACMDKLADDERVHGAPDLDVYTDGASGLEQRTGSAAAWAIWSKDTPVWRDGGSRASSTSSVTQSSRSSPSSVAGRVPTIADRVSPPQHEGVGPAGVGACSYTAEGTAVVAALRHLAADNTTINKRIRVVLDGRSFAQALETGPLSQREYIETQAWEELAILVHPSRNCTVAFVSIFSHCGVPRNEYVDTLAERFMASKDGRNALLPRPMVIYDCVNLRLRETHHYAQERHCPFGRVDDDGRPLVIKRSNMGFVGIEKLGLPRHREVFLCRLRTLCSPEIGEVCHDKGPRRCPICANACMHRKRAVRHMFECSGNERTRAIIEKHELDLTAVPENGKAHAVLLLADEFVREDMRERVGLEAAEGDDAGSDADNGGDV